jgi:hypothetical protein
MNFQFLVELARVKAKTLSGIGSGNRVRPGYHRVKLGQGKILIPGCVGLIPLSRVGLAGFSGLAGLSWDRAKPLTRIGLSLIL